MSKGIAVWTVLAVLLASLWPNLAQADSPDIHGNAGQDFYSLSAHQRLLAESSSRQGSPAQAPRASSTPSVRTKSLSQGSSCGADIDVGLCGAVVLTSCLAADMAQDSLSWFARPGDPCSSEATAPAAIPAAAAPAPLPQVTPGVVLTALRRIGLPALHARTQPEGRTLVNFATIFYTEPEPFTRTITLLGRQVRIQATPSAFTWHHGDGTTATTSSPGSPYPAEDVTHEYRDAHATVRTSVDVTYTATFQVGQRAAQPIPGSVTIAGPTAPLRISEATPVLSGDHS